MRTWLLFYFFGDIIHLILFSASCGTRKRQKPCVLFYAYVLCVIICLAWNLCPFFFYIYFIIYSFRLCLGAWSDHGERTGGFYACNRYETAKQEGVVYLYCPFIFIFIFLLLLFPVGIYKMLWHYYQRAHLVNAWWILSILFPAVWWSWKAKGDGQELPREVYSLLWKMGNQPIGMC